MKVLNVLVIMAVSSATGPVHAQDDFGCGKLVTDVEGGCFLFVPAVGGPYTLDNYGGFVNGDSVHVLGTPGSIANPCNWCGTYQYDCLHDVVIFACEAAGSCCADRTGNANGQGGEEPTISDISALIDALFITGNCSKLPCLLEADVNRSGGCDPTCADITISDVSSLIDCLFIWPGGCEMSTPSCLVCP